MNTKQPSSASELARETEREMVRRLRDNRTAVFAIRLSSYAQQKVDAVVDETVKSGVQFACAKGCGYCCSLEVSSFPQETFRIARELSARPDREAIVAKLAEHVAQNPRGTDRLERQPCPFLVDQACSIYDVRPLACRKCVSLDVERCRQMSETVPSDKAMYYKTEAITLGMVAAYERIKRPSAPHEFISSLLSAMNDPTAEERWWNGEDVFASAD